MVNVRPQYDRTKRTHQIARAESHEGKHQGGELVPGWEKGSTDRRGVIAEDHEVVHLQEISQRDADDCSDFRMLHCRQMVPASGRSCNVDSQGSWLVCSADIKVKPRSIL